MPLVVAPEDAAIEGRSPPSKGTLTKRRRDSLNALENLVHSNQVLKEEEKGGE